MTLRPATSEVELRYELHLKWLSGEGGAKAQFVCADLSDMDLGGRDWRHADFRFSLLARTHFTGSNLAQTRFTGAIAPGAVFRACKMQKTDLRCARLKGADFAGTDLSSVLVDADDQCPWLDEHLLGQRSDGLSYIDLSRADYREVFALKKL